MSVIAGICVFVVLYFIKPFGINELTNKKIFILCIQYAMVTLIFSMLCNTAVPSVFPKIFNDAVWTVKHEIVFLIILVFIVALGNIAFTGFQSHSTISLQLVLKMLKYTFAIGLIPIVISVIIKQQQLLMKYSKGATEIETLISPKHISQNLFKNITDLPVADVILQNTDTVHKNTIPTILQLHGNNLQEALSVDADNFLFAEASDNYTAIHYLHNNLQQKVLYRTTIKNLENQTKEAVSIIRCHKSYLVNLNKVIHISGNAQGYKLHLEQNKVEIPVSRNLNSSIKENFAALKMAK